MKVAEISRRKCMPNTYLDVPDGIEIEEKKI
jgi:hypothetical protein